MARWEDGEPIIEVACSPPVSTTPGALGALGKVPPILMSFVEAVLQCLWSRVQPWLSRGWDNGGVWTALNQWYCWCTKLHPLILGIILWYLEPSQLFAAVLPSTEFRCPLCTFCVFLSPKSDFWKMSSIWLKVLDLRHTMFLVAFNADTKEWRHFSGTHISESNQSFCPYLQSPERTISFLQEIYVQLEI